MSMKNMKRAVAFALLGMIVACGDLGPASPGLTDHVALGAAFDLEFKDGRLALTWLKPLEEELSITQTLTAWGGTLELETAGLRLRVPPFALSEEVELTMSARAGEDVAFDFRPHGTSFRSPVWVSIDLTKVRGGETLLQQLGQCAEPDDAEGGASASAKKGSAQGWWTKGSKGGSVDSSNSETTEANAPDCEFSWMERVSGVDGVYMDPDVTDDVAEALEDFEVWIWGDRWLTFTTDHFSGYALAM